YRCTEASAHTTIRFLFTQDYETSSLNYFDIWLSSGGAERVTFRFGGSRDALSAFHSASTNTMLVDEQGHGLTGKVTIDATLIQENDSVTIRAWFKELDTVINLAAVPLMITDSLTVGFQIRQSTSSFFGRTWVRYFSIGDWQQSPAPGVSTITVRNNRLEVAFDQEVVHHHLINAFVNSSEPIDMKWSHDSMLELTLVSTPMSSIQLELEPICNRFGECGSIDTLISYVPPPPPSRYDVLITELLIDPTPMVELPDAEFIELYNRTNHSIDLDGWMLEDPTMSVQLSNYVVAPAEYVIVCEEEVNDKFKSWGNVCPVQRLPSLNNSSDSIRLRSPNAEIIHDINYSIAHLPTSWKSNGGWSLELIDREYQCHVDNWDWSVDDHGGTPGSENSVDGSVQDNTPPNLMDVVYMGDQRFQLRFDESLDEAPILDHESWITSVSHIGNLLNINTVGLEIDSIHALRLHSVQDCRGNLLPDTLIPIGIPGTIRLNELRISEVLFHTDSVGRKFIEITNTGSGIEDLSALRLGTTDGEFPIELWLVSQESRLIFPGESIAFCKDITLLQHRYASCPTQRMETLIPFPSLSNDKATLALTTLSGNWLDTVTYDQSFHHPLLPSTINVSLERWDSPLAPAGWQSGSAGKGGASPGCPNSGIKPSTKTVKAHPDPFTPNYDGFEDQTQVQLNWSNQLLSVYCTIYDVNGTLMTELLSGAVMHGNETIQWDGILSSGAVAPTGIYIIALDGYSDSRRYHERVPVTVVR
ncbi:MAG: lamin tail domain-containing protein, partial [Bacteroidetes bacterium]|nr:lamin tail domain-containing protein [Bacteroidota bacterium]